ncbi:hypothetical protein [Halorhabdus amylolytica]|uniref:hypothetical protein n=1 Tax=Halorhabdus amylolytica TaxID=2559573 RepID=UPI0010AA13FF|nr:hypothetical protein [Halorhabdus amylolytica]
MDYVNGDDVTNNKHLAEAIDVTREGSAQPGSAGYDEPGSAGPDHTLRDSTFTVAIEELRKIEAAPAESQEEIEEVIELLQRGRNASNEHRARVMAEAHEKLQDIWVPPE